MQNPHFVIKAQQILNTLGPSFNCYHEAWLTGNTQNELKAQLYYSNTQKYMEFNYVPNIAPCQVILDKGQCCFGKDVQKLFPNDKGLTQVNAQAYIGYKTENGLIAVLSPEIIKNPDSILNLLKKCSS